MHRLFADYGPNNPVPVAIMASGGGTLTDAALSSQYKLIDLRVVIVDRECGAEDVAQRHGVTCLRIDRGDYEKGPVGREAWTDAVYRALQEHKIGLVASMGLDTLLAASIFKHYEDRILNSHPARLPGFEGSGHKAIAKTLEAGEATTDSTYHIMTAKMDDDNKILLRIPVSIEPGDTVDVLHERIKVVERHWYPLVLDAYVGGKLGY